MHRIRPWLYIGNYTDTTMPDLLHAHEIGAMLQLAEHVPQAGIAELYLAVEDGEPLPTDLLARGVAFIRAQRAQERHVLVACGAGISRSTTFAIAALHEIEGLSLLDAYRAILERHPDAFPNMALWNSLAAYYGDDMDFRAMWDTLHLHS